MRRGATRIAATTGLILILTHIFVFASFPASASERVVEASAATVFVRVIGKIGVVDNSGFGEEQERNVELGTGSGFVFTPYGQVLTNYHVVSGDTYHVKQGLHDMTLRLTVERIEVVLPSADTDGAPSRFDASVEASDPEVDLAVLSVNGADLPYLALGDSDAADPGEAVSVYGFPFGRDVEVGKTELPDIVPTVSVSRGAVSAVRADDAGNTAFLQTTATVNPGNSGGPMVDAEGFVLGVIRLKLRGGDGIGFAIPVNEVKDFLEVHGYVGLLPVARLRLGAEQSSREKRAPASSSGLDGRPLSDEVDRLFRSRGGLDPLRVRSGRDTLGPAASGRDTSLGRRRDRLVPCHRGEKVTGGVGRAPRSGERDRTGRPDRKRRQDGIRAVRPWEAERESHRPLHRHRGIRRLQSLDPSGIASEHRSRALAHFSGDGRARSRTDGLGGTGPSRSRRAFGGVARRMGGRGIGAVPLSRPRPRRLRPRLVAPGRLHRLSSHRMVALGTESSGGGGGLRGPASGERRARRTRIGSTGSVRDTSSPARSKQSAKASSSGKC